MARRSLRIGAEVPGRWISIAAAALALAWAFAYPDGASGPPIVVGGRVFLASGTGEVFSLDARSGCTWWTHATERLVRGVSFGSAGEGRSAVFFGDHRGFVTALDARTGALLWRARPAVGGDMGGIMYGLAVDASSVYAPISDVDVRAPGRPGGLVALDAATGELRWRVAGREPVCSWGTQGCVAAHVAAVTALPGVVFSGAWDGHLRAYATQDGSLLWDFDTGRSFDAVNGIPAVGGQLSGWPQLAVGGTLYVTSGASSMDRPGNALLVFRVEGGQGARGPAPAVGR